MGKVASTGLTVSGVTFGEAVTAGDLVGWSGGQVVPALGMAGSVVPAVGVAAASYRAGEKGAYHLRCELSGLTGLAAGATQYLSVSTPGAMQSGVPSGAGNFKQAVGYAVAADRMVCVFQDAGVTL